MNQKNIFSVISVVLILQGIGFLVMGNKVVSSAFPNVDEAGHHALVLIMEVVSALSILLGLITYTVRNTPDVLWAYTIGTLILVVFTFKHLFADHVNVPIVAVIIQVLIVLTCAYLWLGGKKA